MKPLFYLIKKIWIYLIIFLVSVFLNSCETDKLVNDLEPTDNYIYYDSRIAFEPLYYTYEITPINYFKLFTTVSVPNDVIVKDYGFCWVIQRGFDGLPKISDNYSSSGPTNLRNISIVKIFDNEPYLLYGMIFYRAYVKTDKGIVYDNHQYYW